MKKKLLLLIAFVFSFSILTGCSEKEKEVEKSDAIKFKEEYESINGIVREKDGKEIRTIEIDEENPFVYKEAEDIVEMIKNKETFVVYFGFKDCPWCRSVLPTLVEVSKDLGLDTIYYVDVKDIRDVVKLDEEGNQVTEKEGSKEYYQLLEVLDNVLVDYTLTDSEGNKIETGEKRIMAPNVVSVVKGVPEVLETGISENQKNGYQKLTDEMIKETYEKFKCALKCVINKAKTCSYDQNGC